MGRYRHQVYTNDTRPRWVAVFGLQWQVIESHRLEPATDLYGAMTAAIERLAAEGWQIEAEPPGSVADALRRRHADICRDRPDNQGTAESSGEK
jgi:hypothetical protein